MFKSISKLILSHGIGRLFKLEDKTVAWKKVTELKAGMRIAVANSSGYSHERPEGVEWDEIVSVKKLAPERVYDIEVEGTHNFVGNGIVAHNTSGILMRAGASSLQLSSSSTSTTADIQLAAADRIDLFAGSLSLQTSSQTAGELKLMSKGSLILDTSGAAGGGAPIVMLGGNVGIGTTGPANKLDVRRSTSAGSDTIGTGDITLGIDNPYWTFRQSATALSDLAIDRLYAGTNYEVMRIQRSTGNVGIGTTNPDQAKLFVSGGMFLTLDTSGTTASGVCWDDSGGSLLYDCDSAPTDLAENFGTDDSTLEAGDVVVAIDDPRSGEITHEGSKTSKAYISKSTSGYQSGLLGVVSTQPNQLYGDDGLFTVDENPKPVSLVGRVPVKIAPDSLPIKTGDSLTSSDTYPGMAMKATKAGEVIGKALESWQPCNENLDIENSLKIENCKLKIDKIVMFVNPGYYMGPMTADGYIDTRLKLKVADVKIDTSSVTSDSANVIPGVDPGSIQIDSGSGAGMTELNSLKTRVAQLEDLVAIMAGFASPELLTQAGTNTLSTSNSDLRFQNSVFSLTGSYMDSEVNLGSGLVSPLPSAGLTLTGSNDELPFSIQNSVFSILSSATIGGSLTVGLITIDDMNASINSMSETLKIQNQALANIDFLNGKIVMTKTGDMQIRGNLTVNGDLIVGGTVAGTKIEILEQPENTATDSARPTAASIGETVIPAGETEMTIYSTAVGINSKVFVTADQPIAIGAKVTGARQFIIELAKPETTDLKVNWWVVN